MKTVGLITEYNPFHKGHLYHLKKAKELTGADHVIVVMSGDFVQRGVPAIMNKFTRAHMALSEGADLVLELPCVYATASAEFFALGAVSLLTKLGCVDCLCFGSECGRIDLLSQAASFFLQEPDNYQTALKYYLQAGKSYPSARAAALSDTFTQISSDADITDLLKEPNNILALEYLKAIQKLGSPLIPVTLKRAGASYHTDKLTKTFSSATAIRKSLLTSSNYGDILQKQLPPKAYDVACTALTLDAPISANDFSAYLSYALIMQKHHLTDYLDVDSDLSDRIINHLADYTGYTDFAALLKTKTYTHTRITRCLCHIMLDIQKEHMNYYLSQGRNFYARALGFRRSAAPLLKAIKNHGSIPLITKLSREESTLSAAGQNMLQQDIQASALYHSLPTKKGMAYNEYTKPLIIL